MSAFGQFNIIWNAERMQKKHSSSQTIYIAQQPIFTKDRTTHAYELLFRQGIEEFAKIFDADYATQRVVYNTMNGFGLDEVVGEHMAFINYGRGMLLEPLSLPPERVVIEILEDVGLDEDVVSAAKKLIGQGFQLALDDFQYKLGIEKLLELANYVKFDLSLQSESELQSCIDMVKPFEVQMVAEKVENQQQFDFCQKLDFDYYQGYYLKKPIILKGKIG